MIVTLGKLAILDSRKQGIFRIVVFCVVALIYVSIPNARPDFTRFNCHDSESYLALSGSLVHGAGYTRNMKPNQYVAHTTWPPVVPVLMMPAMALSGDKINWLAVKWSMVIVGLIGVVCVWLLARRIGGSDFYGDLAALAIALNPLYWDFSHQAMAEVPLTVWLLGSILLIDYCWVGRKVRLREALTVGCICGIGMLIKGHAIGLMLAPLAHIVGKRRTVLSHRSHLLIWLLFCVGFALPFLCWLGRNQTVDASGFDGISQIRMIRQKNPTDVNSELLTLSESITVVTKNLKNYVIYFIPSQIIPSLQYEEIYNWSGSGFVFLPLTIIILLMCFSRFIGVLSLHIVPLPIAILNIQYAFGGAQRFWISLSIIMTVIIAIKISNTLFFLEKRKKMVFCIIVFLMTCNFAFYIFSHEKNPYSQAGPWKELAEFFEKVSTIHITTTGVLTPNEQAFQLITGYPSPMHIKGQQYDHIVVRLDDKSKQLPQGSHKILDNYPFALYSLPRLMDIQELQALGLTEVQITSKNKATTQ